MSIIIKEYKDPYHSYKLESGVYTIHENERGSEVFKQNPYMATAKFSDDIEEILFEEFLDDYMLSYVVLPKNLKIIRSRAFVYSGLKVLIIPEETEVIEKLAFAHCGELKHVYIPNSVKRIEYGAFKDCTKLESFRFPKNLGYFDPKSFFGPIKLDPKNVLNPPKGLIENGWKRSPRTVQDVLYGVDEG